MRIAIDAVGGDHAPDEIIAGVLESIKELDKDDELMLVGPRDIIEAQLKSRKCPKDSVTIIHAPDIIGMADVPIETLRKKPKSSIAILSKLGKLGQTDAVISAGNTGPVSRPFK